MPIAEFLKLLAVKLIRHFPQRIVSSSRVTEATQKVNQPLPGVRHLNPPAPYRFPTADSSRTRQPAPRLSERHRVDASRSRHVRRSVAQRQELEKPGTRDVVVRVPGIFVAARLAAFDNLMDAVGDQAVRLPVNAHRRVRGGRLDEAERLVVLLVDPVLHVSDAVRVLLGQVRLMCVRDVRHGGTIRELLVDVYEKRQGHISCV